MEEKNFEELYNESLKETKLEKTVTGTVIQVTSKGEIFVDLKCDNTLCEELGAPREFQVIYTLTKEKMKIGVSWFNKDANRLTEAIFFKVYPTDSKIKLEKLGGFIDPYTVVGKGSKNLHAVRNVILGNDKNTIKITNLTSPLLSIGKGKILEFDDKFEEIEAGLSYVLYNNVWGTNFPLWYEENALFEFEINADSYIDF